MTQDFIRRWEQVVVHLMDHIGTVVHDCGTKPLAMTQYGISEDLGITVSHVSILMRELIERGLVEKGLCHVNGRSCRVSCYALTPAGIVAARNSKERMESMESTRNRFHRGRVDLDIEMARDELRTAVDLLRDASVTGKKGPILTAADHIATALGKMAEAME